MFVHYEINDYYFMYDVNDSRGFCRAFHAGVKCDLIDVANDNERIKGVK